MRLALEEARDAAGAGEVPVGALVVSEAGEILARRHNEREGRSDPTAHAEMLAISDAAGILGDWRLGGCSVVVSLEPCPMCAGALVAARAARVVFAASDPKAGACGSLYNICADPRLNWELEVIGGVLSQEAGQVLSEFFSSRRRPSGAPGAMPGAAT